MDGIGGDCPRAPGSKGRAVEATILSEWLSENFHQLKPPLFGNGIQAETPG